MNQRRLHPLRALTIAQVVFPPVLWICHNHPHRRGTITIIISIITKIFHVIHLILLNNIGHKTSPNPIKAKIALTLESCTMLWIEIWITILNSHRQRKRVTGVECILLCWLHTIPSLTLGMSTHCQSTMITATNRTSKYTRTRQQCLGKKPSNDLNACCRRAFHIRLFSSIRVIPGKNSTYWICFMTRCNTLIRSLNDQNIHITREFSYHLFSLLLCHFQQIHWIFSSVLYHEILL